MYGCESWTIKKAEHRGIDAFELWCWEKTLESSLDWKEIKSVNPNKNQYLIFIGKTDAEAEAPILWSKELSHWKRFWCWETLKAGVEGDNRGGDGWMASPTQRTWAWEGSGRWWRTGDPDDLQSMGSYRVGHNWVTKQQLNTHTHTHTHTHTGFGVRK